MPTRKPPTRRSRSRTTALLFFTFLSLLAFGFAFPAYFFISSLSTSSHHHHHHHQRHLRIGNDKFEIEDDKFWRDGKPFQIIGGDLHYFRVVPQYWEDRLLRAKALGLNTIQTYVPWNLHEPKPGKVVFDGIADLVAFLKLCQKLELVVMLRVGPYICGEWDLGGFPAWLLAIKPDIKLRSSDPAYLQLVDRWWAILLPKIAPFLYGNGGPVIMVQIENEYGSYGNDKDYLHHLVVFARRHLGANIILYTTDGGSRETLEKGTILGSAVYSAVDFTTGDEPWHIFKLQKKFNARGRSPPLSSEFYTGWLTHWSEKNAQTNAEFTASALEKILSGNGSAVLYMAHGGTNFGFYNGANTGTNESDYEPDLTSYDYDAPIRESGDVDNPKFHALRKVIGKYSTAPLPPIPSDIDKGEYGSIQLHETALLFDMMLDPVDEVQSQNPLPMESIGQMFGFLLYVSEYASKNIESSLHIPKVHDRAQVFVRCPSVTNLSRPTYVGTIERWSNQAIGIRNVKCISKIQLLILVENMGRVNYGPHIFDRKGILSSVYLDGKILHGWKMRPLPFDNLNEVHKNNLIFQLVSSRLREPIIHEKRKPQSYIVPKEPAIFAGRFSIDKKTEVKDTYISFTGWSKGIAFVNEFNIGRYWPSSGPQCNLYIPAPILRRGENTVVVFELESANPELVVYSVDQPDFTCGSNVQQL